MSSSQLSWPPTLSRGTILRSGLSGGCGLAICFDRLHDRQAHAIYGLEPAGEVLLIASQEGTADDIWPVSPPLQHLTVERRGAQRTVALLIGMAGASHWSLSVDFDLAKPRLRFEFACRCVSEPEQLGSSYRLLRAPTWGSSSATWTSEQGHRWVVSPLPQGSGTTLLKAWHEGLRWEPTRLDNSSWPRTISWGFEVACDEPENPLI